MHLAGVGASPSSDSLALSHLGDDSWWHLPLVPRPPGSEAITVVNQTELHHSFSENSYTQKTKKKKENSACLQVYLHTIVQHTFLEYTPPLHIVPWLLSPRAGCFTKSFSCQRPCSHCSLETIASNRPGRFEGADFLGEIIGKPQKKQTSKNVKKIWRLCFFWNFVL